MDVVKHFELLMSVGLWGAVTIKKAIKVCYGFIQTRKNRENKIFKPFLAYSQASLINLSCGFWCNLYTDVTISDTLKNAERIFISDKILV